MTTLRHAGSLFTQGSQDGQILNIRNKDERTVSLTLAFWPRHPAEFEFFKARIADFKFSERSSLARIGIEMLLQGPPVIDGHRATLEAEALSAADEAVVRKIRGRIALLRLALAGRGPGADRVHIPVEYLARWIERVSATPASAHPSAPTPPVADPERD